MLGQALLDRCELLNQELQLQSGEVDVTRGLLALNVAQDYFESIAAQRGKIFGGAIGTVTTTANTESTAFPAGLLRVDRMQTINSTTLRPDGELTRLKRTGGHAVTSLWPLNLVVSTSTGKPASYWTDGSNIYWAPLPDATYTVRYYGFKAASDLTAGGTFAYPDIVAFPIAAFAVKVLLSGVGDGLGDMSGLAADAFSQVLNALSSGDRDGATGFEYTRIHTT